MTIPLNLYILQKKDFGYFLISCWLDNLVQETSEEMKYTNRNPRISYFHFAATALNKKFLYFCLK